MMVLAQHHPSKATARGGGSGYRTSIGVGVSTLRSFYAEGRIHLHCGLPPSFQRKACRPGAKEFHWNGPCHLCGYPRPLWQSGGLEKPAGRAPAGEEADRGELDLGLKPGSSGDVAALASYNLSSERTLSNRTIFMRQNDW